MIIGVPREIKESEYRVGLVPSGAHQLIDDDHQVVIESGAGAGSGFEDDEYEKAGATVVPNAGEVYSLSDMVVKVKEPIEPEYELLRDGQILFLLSASGATAAADRGAPAAKGHGNRLRDAPRSEGRVASSDTNE